mgnify:CR=1 FL=1
MEKVLVTGATGFIGYEVARQLAVKGFKPRLLVRRPFRGMILKALEAELVQGDLLDAQGLRRAVAGIDTVIHLGAVAAFISYRRVRPSIVDGSRNLMEAARENGVKKFVYGGTLLVYGSRQQPIDQATPASPVLGYGRAKFEAEQMMAALERNCREFGVPLFGLGSDDQGIVHVIGPELGLTQPGMTIACGDSHTSTHGAFGAVAFGIGTSQVRDVLATQTLSLARPKVRCIDVAGSLPRGEAAKDVILAIIARLGVKLDADTLVSEMPVGHKQFTEIAREREGVVRTPHPIYSFAVFGQHAREYERCDDIEAFGENSVFSLFHKM